MLIAGANVNQYRGETALIVAAGYGHTAIMHLLIKYGANIDH
jgi:ankyrin repeat protein